jgi:hypothetical protein
MPSPITIPASKLTWGQHSRVQVAMLRKIQRLREDECSRSAVAASLQESP